MARIALVSFYDYESLPVRLLHSVLKDHGHQPLSVFFKRHALDRMGPPSEREYQILLETVERASPLFVGLSLRSSYASVAKEAADRLRAAGHTVVWGGTHATVAPEDAIGHADAVCVGEGDAAILEITERLEAGKDLTGIDNLWVRRNQEVVRAGLRPLLEDLDSLPFPWWGADDCLYVDDDKACDELPAGFMTSYDMMTSRGCPYRCTYCLHSMLVDRYRGLGKYLRRRSPEDVVEELALAKQRFPALNRVRFWDDVFTLNQAWLERFSPLYKKNVDLPFFAYTTPNLAKHNTLSLLKQAGLRYIGMGIQSGSERVRKQVFDRAVPTKTMLEAAQAFRSFDLYPEYDLIIDNPFEQKADFQETLELLLRLPRPFSLYQHSLTYFPNYAITERALAEGHIQPDEVEHVSGKGFTQWHDEFSRNRDNNNTFYATLNFLSQFRLIPRTLVRALSRSRYFEARPALLSRLVEPFGRAALKGRWVFHLLEERGLGGAFRRLANKLLLRLGASRAPQVAP